MPPNRALDDPKRPDQDWGASDRAHRAHSRPPTDQLPGTSIVPNRSTRAAPIRPVSSGPDEPPPKQINFSALR
jgi:hypothetical protein